MNNSHPPRRCRRYRRAFTLYEMVLAMGMLLFAMNFGTQLFRADMQVLSHGNQLFNQTMQTDAALGQMRKDVWGSTKISVGDAHHADLTDGDGQVVSWHINGDGSLDRNDAAAARHWALIGKEWSFAAGDGCLAVSDANSTGSRAVRLVSQVLADARGNP